MVHVFDDDQLGRPRATCALFGEEFWDDAGDAAVVGEHRLGDLAHQAETAAAVDEADPGLRHLLPSALAAATQASFLPLLEPQ